MNNQNTHVHLEKLYCQYCEMNPTIEIPDNVDLKSDSSNEFVRNVRCTICKTIGNVRK